MRTRLLFLFSILTVHNLQPFAEEVTMKAEKAVVITFPSQPNRTYNVLGAETAEGPWRSLQDGIAGTGGEVTIFYKSESDQKLFFKVEGAEGSPTLTNRSALLAVARLDLSDQNLAGRQFPGEDLQNFTLEGTIFDSSNLRGANLLEATANGASFVGADLRGVLTDASTSLVGANFSGANLEGIRLTAALDRAIFRDANLRGAVLWTSLQEADFREAELAGARFVFANLGRANFSGQNLSNVTFHYSNLEGTDLTGANLAGADLSRSYLAPKLENANLRDVNLEASRISGNLAARDLRGSILRGAVLQSDWSGVNAAGIDGSLMLGFPASFGNGALNLSEANLAGANLEGAVLYQVNLHGAQLQNAKLRGANLIQADLRNVNFTDADLSFAQFEGANLNGATGFDPEQPGMDFGKGTTLPGGTVRSGKNPGTGLAPTTVPSRLRFDINDLGTVATREFVFSGSNYTENGVAKNDFSYEADAMIATLRFALASNPVARDQYTLLFTSGTEGKLFKNIRNGTAGVFQIGTFAVPQ